MPSYSLRGLYAITDHQLIPADQFVEIVEQAILGGAKVIQYRNKTENYALRVKQAQALRALCNCYQIPLIINDDLALMQTVKADGIHLGKKDASVITAREMLGNEVIIGISCYNQLTMAQQALNHGASYIAFGSFFPSPTKPQAVSASVELLTTARPTLDCPIVAIGGITPDNGAQLIAAGADSLAVIHGIFGQSDIVAAARRYAQLWERVDNSQTRLRETSPPARLIT